jgi:hypothetical protein
MPGVRVHDSGGAEMLQRSMFHFNGCTSSQNINLGYIFAKGKFNSGEVYSGRWARQETHCCLCHTRNTYEIQNTSIQNNSSISGESDS